MLKLFKDRTDAGRQLAKTLENYKGMPDVIVLGLARGGIPIAYTIAMLLNLPLDVFIVRKLGAPEHEEFAIGAIAANDICVFNKEALSYFNPSPELLEQIIEKESIELERRNKLYRQGRPTPNLHNKKVILVDDGIATGASVKVALLALKQFEPKEIILAVPILPKEVVETLSKLVDNLFYIDTPEPFYGVGSWYRNFKQVSDIEVITLLSQAQQRCK